MISIVINQIFPKQNISDFRFNKIYPLTQLASNQSQSVMEKMKAHKCCYFISYSFFFVLCFIGLCYQVGQISFNYFRFQVVSNVQVIIPGNETRKALNVCFDFEEFIDKKKYSTIIEEKYKSGIISNSLYKNRDSRMNKIISDHFTIRDRLNIAPSSPLHFKASNYSSIPYVIDRLVCYHASPQEQSTVALPIDRYRNKFDGEYFWTTISLWKLDSVHSIRVADSRIGKYATYEFNLVDPIENLQSNKSGIVVYVVSFSIFLEKLEFPYVDDCMDYSLIGYTDQDDAINFCISNEMIHEQSMVFRMKSFDYPVDYVALMDSPKNFSSLTDRCRLIHRRPNCNLELLSTKVTHGRVQVPYFYIQQMFSTEPSFGFHSQPKIEIVDYVTYIFGALGTWLGFSFLGINPVSVFCTVKKSEGPSQKSEQEMNELICGHNKAISNLIMIAKGQRDRIVRLEAAQFRIHGTSRLFCSNYRLRNNN